MKRILDAIPAFLLSLGIWVTGIGGLLAIGSQLGISAPLNKTNPHDHSGEEKHQDKDAHASDEAHSKADEHEEDAHDEHGEEGHGSEEEGAEESAGGVGPGKAITAASKRVGIKLSEKAIQALEIRWQPVQSTTTHQIPVQSLVMFQSEVGVYRLRDGWFKLAEGKIISRSELSVTFQSGEIRPGDQLVISGVPLLRVTELEAWGGSGDGHGH